MTRSSQIQSRRCPVFESLQRAQRSDLSRPKPLFQQHEYLRKSLFLLSVKKVVCPKTESALAEEKRKRAEQIAELSSSSSDEDSDDENEAGLIEDRFGGKYVDDHIVTFAVIDNQIKHMERIASAQSRAETTGGDGSDDDVMYPEDDTARQPGLRGVKTQDVRAQILQEICSMVVDACHETLNIQFQQESEKRSMMKARPA